MDIYLAGISRVATQLVDRLSPSKEGLQKWDNPIYEDGFYYKDDKKMLNLKALESFYYADQRTEILIPRLTKFILDSGAFTFFTSGKAVNWDTYVEKYADFINKNNVERFFELDIDKLVGYNEVIRLRNKLERLTNKPCVPVWHTFRGKEKFKEMCKAYKYVAIGGIVSREIKPSQYPYFTWFINTAHSEGAKIHGLGFTNIRGLSKYHFDSVDSTAWISGNKFGGLYFFNGKTIVKISRKTNQRMKNPKKLLAVNYNEWRKFSNYAEYNL